MNHVNPVPGCRCMHHKIVPILIILFGLNFLLGTLGYLNITIARFGWPVIIMLIGLVQLFSGSCACCQKAA
ncbi:MAG: hypothetical protein JWL88_271 [Parcubacteria group bacterium]|nr:hypothetical protein [Parcubacteria group bacterium]